MIVGSKGQLEHPAAELLHKLIQPSDTWALAGVLTRLDGEVCSGYLRIARKLNGRILIGSYRRSWCNQRPAQTYERRSDFPDGKRHQYPMCRPDRPCINHLP
ncbi:hypothetical protein NSPZN2_40073 [Nitrospira defluvii]|uniref:Uncharacterized protein n=1 Tax=Nitrospira defluvii TaxID=330214 RepID=A0ABN7LU97_9BACT|nr:hypothetical protein NSPZN2_40073 [Nitrospira defluvii]